jgi:ubiquinone/menaquinone biosynthesis C-methylase UbiE
MTLESVMKNWEKFAETDPLWAIYTDKKKRGNKWQIDEFFATGEKYVSDLFMFVEASKVKVSFGKVFDFGCGVGRITQALANRFDEAYGVDISPTMIELAQKYNRFGCSCHYYVNNADDLKLFADNTFDFVHSVIVLQHMKPKFAKVYLKEFLRITCPNGIIAFQEPSHIISSKKPKVMLQQSIIHAKAALTKKPFMDMNGIKRTELESFIKEINGDLINVKHDNHASADWASYTYLVKKIS